MSYNVETIIAEKFETMINRSIKNSRMKDFYDLYILLNQNNYNNAILSQAIINTFKERQTNLNDVSTIVDLISKSDFIKNRFENYKKKHEFSKNVEYEEIIEVIKDKLINLI